MEDSCCIAKCLDESTESVGFELKVGCVMKELPGLGTISPRLKEMCILYGHVHVCGGCRDTVDCIQQYKYTGPREDHAR